jgi:bifunctional non-homologous end joining protein LigD
MARAASRSRQSLKEYEAKRDFSKSPEPTGRASPKRRTRAKRGPRFVVQKHLASHLHYDFRLEHRGVLLSWAVPKGPSLNPTDKRLAMHVEDHPLDYGDFEGVIPSGYGAGIVMLWDQGTWEPAPGFEDIDKALDKGELKFSLDGVKLKGSWVLVRTSGRFAGGRGSNDGGGPSRSWLLIKHRDEWAGDVDVLAAAPMSVKSFGDLADILAADNPNVWESHRPVEGGATGRLLSDVIEQAAAIKAKRFDGRRGKKKTTSKKSASKKARKRSRAATSRR